MKRTVALSALWVVVAVAAVTVAWQGVAVVGDQVTDERPAALAASDIEDRLAGATTTTSGTDTSTTSSTSSAPSTSTVDSSTSTSPENTTTTAVRSTPATSTTSSPATTSAAGETRTYNLVGGTASLRFLPSGVEVVFANPAPGFTVEIEPEHVNGVKVEFESPTHESRVDGWWEGGPVDRVREKSED